MRYRRKQIEIEAFRLADATWPDWGTLAFGAGVLAVALDPIEGHWVGNIQTPAGDLQIEEGAWIARTPTGEIYPIAPDVFEGLYEIAEG